MDEVRDTEDFHAEVMDLWRLFDVNGRLCPGPPHADATAPGGRQRRRSTSPWHVSPFSSCLTRRQKAVRACLLAATVLLACGLLVASDPDMRRAFAAAAHALWGARH